ncbi:hypothetical protein GCM10025867_14440 [Frondihabitans sucicola]|uniref:Uncharacterized protein n=1 Tax=Frondihabitans sucicola TaxID=1268041 RepID=A0ABM8GLY3_9MICO|nr:hypothetical protein GCM10025867_14440 [Frondihabitans sucicola]
MILGLAVVLSALTIFDRALRTRAAAAPATTAEQDAERFDEPEAVTTPDTPAEIEGDSASHLAPAPIAGPSAGNPLRFREGAGERRGHPAPPRPRFREGAAGESDEGMHRAVDLESGRAA